MIREIRYTQNPGTDVLTWDVGYVDDSVGTIIFANLRGGEYSVRARLDIAGAKTGFGSVNTTTVSPMTLSAPANFVVSEKYSNSITLQWDQVANAESIIIEYSLDDVTYSSLATIDGSLIEYIHNGLTANTTYYYRIKAIGDGTETDYLDSGYSTVFDTTNTTIILLSDDFTGTTIDTSKHFVVNSNPSAISISQNDKLLFETLGTTNVGLEANRVSALNPITNYKFAVTFDLSTVLDGTDFQFFAQIINNDVTYAARILRTATNMARIAVRDSVNAGGTIYDFTTSIPIDGTKWKIYKEETSVSFYYWDGSAWVQAGSTVNVIFDDEMYYSWTTNATNVGQNTLGVDNLYLTDDNYATITPS